MEESDQVNSEKASGALESDALSEEEQAQFAEWLSRQDPGRRAHYLKLAQAYGFQADT